MNCQQVLQVGIVVILVTFFLVGCGGSAPTAVSEAPAATSAQEQAATPKPPTPEPPTPTEELKPEESVATEEPATDGPRTGDIAPDFTLPDSNGTMVHLADELKDNRVVVLVFYHSYE